MGLHLEKSRLLFSFMVVRCWMLVCAQVLHETLSPAWCETLLFDRVLMEGIPEQLRQDPPLIVINIYSHSSMVALTLHFQPKWRLQGEFWE